MINAIVAYSVRCVLLDFRQILWWFLIFHEHVFVRPLLLCSTIDEQDERKRKGEDPFKVYMSVDSVYDTLLVSLKIARKRN